MTGFGMADCREDGIYVSVEIKTVNNRYLKTSIRVSEGFGAYETRIEALLRETLSRGTVNLSVRIRREQSGSGTRINRHMLTSYYRELSEIGKSLGVTGHGHVTLDHLLRLPGVVEDEGPLADETLETIWKKVEKTVKDALGQLQKMRTVEGASMESDLTANLALLETAIGEIERLAPTVVEQYRQKISDRVSKVLAEHRFTLNPNDLIREVALFADKCDISEEIVRFRSHLVQFRQAMAETDSCGRKLDFLIQEFLRETNTIGSKSNDSGITKHVVEMKTVIERLREMAQNVE